MPSREDADFLRQRATAFDEVLSLVEARRNAATPVLTLQLAEKSPDTLRAGAAKDVWVLFHGGIRHLKNGAPEGQPGSMAEAVARVSLRASPFAAALGIPAPQFEQVPFGVDYTDGRDATFFLCHRLVEAAESDFPKSRQIIQKKILDEKPSVEELKEQMALSFNVLAEVYTGICAEMKESLNALSG